jgi:hypothetical protein
LDRNQIKQQKKTWKKDGQRNPSAFSAVKKKSPCFGQRFPGTLASATTH